ncbi:ATP synthase gamma chain [Streptomyces alboniger]
MAHYNFRERKVSESWSGFTDEPTYADAKKVAGPLIEAIKEDSEGRTMDGAWRWYRDLVEVVAEAEKRRLALHLAGRCRGGQDGGVATFGWLDEVDEDVLNALSLSESV